MEKDSINGIRHGSVLLIRNSKGTLVNRLFWFLVRLLQGLFFCLQELKTTKNLLVLLKLKPAYHNHCQLVLATGPNKALVIWESTIVGFVPTKTLATWIEQQKEKQRDFKVVNPKGFSQQRLLNIWGNSYDANYFRYLFFSYSDQKATNCFQSVAYIFNLPNWWLATSKTFL